MARRSLKTPTNAAGKLFSYLENRRMQMQQMWQMCQFAHFHKVAESEKESKSQTSRRQQLKIGVKKQTLRILSAFQGSH